MRRWKETLFVSGAATVFACSSRDDRPVAWNCSDVAVPNGTAAECTASGTSALDGAYTCNNGGDYNPNCPPTNGDGGTDGSTTDFNPDAGTTTTGGDGGTTGGDGGTIDGVPDGGSSSGSDSGGGTTGGNDGGTIDGVPDGGSGADASTCHGNCGPPGHDRDGGSSGPPGSESDGGTDGPPWKCEAQGGNVTCHRPPKCDPGTHPAPCGACVPDGTDDDCTPPSAGGCWVTGGGFIIDADGRDSFGGNGMPMKSGVVRGEWEHQDHGTGDTMHGQVAYLYCRRVAGAGPGHPNGPRHTFDLNQVYYGGPGRWQVGGAWSDGYWFDIVAEDRGEPGRADFYQITIRKYVSTNQSGPIVYQTSGTLAGGNIQLHPPNAGHPYSSPAMPPWVALQP